MRLKFFFFLVSDTYLLQMTLSRMPIAMLKKMQPDTVPQALHVLLSKMLCQVPVRSSWLLRQQDRLPLLQQLEDQEWRTQMPLKRFLLMTRCFSLTEDQLALILLLVVPIIRSSTYDQLYSPPRGIFI